MRPSASASRGSGNGYRVLKKGAGMPVILAQKKKVPGYFSARIPPYRRRPGDGDGHPTLSYPRAPCRLPAISRFSLPPLTTRGARFILLTHVQPTKFHAPSSSNPHGV